MLKNCIGAPRRSSSRSRMGLVYWAACSMSSADSFTMLKTVNYTNVTNSWTETRRASNTPLTGYRVTSQHALVGCRRIQHRENGKSKVLAGNVLPSAVQEGKKWAKLNVFLLGCLLSLWLAFFSIFSPRYTPYHEQISSLLFLLPRIDKN